MADGNVTRRIGLGFAILALAGAAFGQKYETKDGCDDGRWSEWESIIISAEGYPEEQADARSVRDYNRELCARMDAGELTQEQSDALYEQALDAWVKRIERREAERSAPPAGGAGTG